MSISSLNHNPNDRSSDNSGSTPISDWRNALRLAYRRPQELLNALEITDHDKLVDLNPSFAFLVPREFAARMRRGDINDPLLRQVLPLLNESQIHNDFVHDPNSESHYQQSPGLLKKYAQRALIITTGACAVHCRYCFRRHFPYQDAVGKQRFNEIVTQLENDRDISEVILSGGDPLSLADDKLSEIIERLNTISHLKRLRIHTRLPIVIPQRITPALISMLSTTGLNIALVVHANHANEINFETRSQLQLLHRAGINLLNQSVLLRGVNASANCLSELSEVLFEANVVPYYVHLLDPVAGSAHFAVADNEAREIERQLRHTLPGYLLPKFVRELAGESAKTPLQLL